MGTTFRIALTGPEQTAQRLQAGQPKLRSKLRKVGNEGSKVVLRGMKTQVPTARGDYGPGGSTKKSLGRKVTVKQNRMWFGVGPRSKWHRMLVRKHKYFRDAQGNVRKFKNTRPAKVRPSRLMHLIEKQSGFMRRTAQATKMHATAAMQQTMAEFVTEV